MQIVSFDFGEKKIGIAVGQTKTKSSSPYKVIFNKKNQINWLDIKEVLKEWNPKLIIIGKPLNMDGSRSEIMKKVENFFNKIKNLTDAKCIYVDERLTSFDARDNINKFLLESGDKNFNNELVDSHAAQILIDNWLENDNTI